MAGEHTLAEPRSNQGYTMVMNTYTPLTIVPTKYQLPTLYGF